MLAVSDMIGLFIMPFAVTMHNYAYDLMNQLGLIFIPFIIVLVREFFNARTQGQDNGGAAVLYIQGVEVEFIKRFFILAMFVMPVTSGNTTYSYIQYSQSSHPGMFEDATSVSDLNPNTNFNDILGTGQVPLLFGLINNITVALDNSLLAKAPCTVSSTTSKCIVDSNPGAIWEALDGIQPTQNETNQAITEFADACYFKGLTNYFKATESDTEELNLLELSFPNNSGQKYAFFSDFMNSVYLGVYDIDGYNDEPQLWITTSDAWSSSSVGSDATVKCQTASLALYDVLVDEMQNMDNYNYNSTIMTAWVDYNQRYGGDENEIVATNALAKQEFVSAMFSNSYRSNNEGVLDYLDNAANDAASTISSALDRSFEMSKNQINGLKHVYKSVFTSDLKTKHGGEYLKTVGLNGMHMVTAGYGAAEAYTENQTYVRTIPVIMQLTVGALLMFSPIIILLSGFDTGVTYKIVCMYIATCFSPYVFEIGQIIGSNIIAIAGDSSYTIQQFGEDVTSTSSLQGIWIGYKMPLIAVGIWNVLMMLVSRTPLPNILTTASQASILNSDEINLMTEGFKETIAKRLANTDFFKSLTKEEQDVLVDGYLAGIDEELSTMSDKEIKDMLKDYKGN